MFADGDLVFNLAANQGLILTTVATWFMTACRPI
jgi:hypothetical protein